MKVPMKTCTLCKVEKPVSEYYRYPDGRLFGRCKSCRKASMAVAKANHYRSKPLTDRQLAVLRACNVPDGSTHAEICESAGYVAGTIFAGLIERGLLEELLISPRNTGELQRGNRPRKKWRTTPKGRERITEPDLKEV